MARVLWYAAGATRKECTGAAKRNINSNIINVHVPGTGTTTNCKSRFLPASLALLLQASTSNSTSWQLLSIHHTNSTSSNSNFTNTTRCGGEQRKCTDLDNNSSVSNNNASINNIRSRTLHSSSDNWKLRSIASNINIHTSSASSSLLGSNARWQPWPFSPGSKLRSGIRWLSVKPGYRIRGSDGQYEIVRFLGQGSYGEVYQARSIPGGLMVAVKTMPNYTLAATNPVGQMRVVREISAMMTLRHPHVIGLYDISYDPLKYDLDAVLSLVMEYMPGGDMEDHCFLQPGQRLPEPEARRFFQQLVDGVSFCHSRNVVHRDLKPGNLLLDAARRNLKVADFGLSAIGPTKADGTGRLGTTVGTVTFEAPEVVANAIVTNPRTFGAGYAGPPADVYSCGCILYFFLAGTTPFGYLADPAQQYRHITTQPVNYPASQFSPGVADLLRQLLDPDPARRITTDGVYRHPWFQVGYTPPDYTQMGAVQANRAAVDAVFGMPNSWSRGGVPGPRHSVDLPRPPVHWKHQEGLVNNYAFGEGYPRDMGVGHFVVDESLSFTTDASPEQVVNHVTNLVRKWGLKTRVRNYTIDISGSLRGFHGQYEFQEPLEVLVDILSIPPKLARDRQHHRYMVEFRRVTGDFKDFERFRTRMTDKSKDIMELLPPPTGWDYFS